MSFVITRLNTTLGYRIERNRFWETQFWALLFLVFLVMLHPLHPKYKCYEKSFILPRDKNEFCQFHTNLEFESLGNLHIQIFFIYPRRVNLTFPIHTNLTFFRKNEFWLYVFYIFVCVYGHVTMNSPDSLVVVVNKNCINDIFIIHLIYFIIC